MPSNPSAAQELLTPSSPRAYEFRRSDARLPRSNATAPLPARSEPASPKRIMGSPEPPVPDPVFGGRGATVTLGRAVEVAVGGTTDGVGVIVAVPVAVGVAVGVLVVGDALGVVD